MIEWMLAMAFLGEGVSASLPDQVTCHTTYSLRRHGAIRARAACPDVPGQDWLERTTRDQVNMAQIRRPNENTIWEVGQENSRLSETGQVSYARYEVDGETYWAIQPGAISLRAARYPEPAFVNEWNAACVAHFRVVNGRPGNACVACNAEDVPSHFRRSMRQAVYSSIYVNTETPIDIVYRFVFSLDERPVPEFPDTPDCQEAE
ncbi:hypothetical protein [Hyphobacterium sp.]|uniref:hypothetical protein n=1 Tax=Hyphobacterium sp. TaxID=2004662 RepID=UPI003BA926BA